MTTALTLRRAQDDDVDALVALDAAGFTSDAWHADAWRAELGGPGRRVVVAEQDDVLIGAVVTMTLGDVCDLVRIVVAPEVRRTGVAGRLLADALDAARADGAHRMLLEVSAANRGAIAFYVAADFTQIDTRPRYYRDGSDALILRRNLGPTCNWRP